MENRNNNIPRMMSVRQIAATGLINESALRRMLKAGQLPAIYSGTKALINFDILCNMLSNLQPAC